MGFDLARRPGRDTIGKRQQGVAGENRVRLAELHPHRRLTAPLAVVVHRRKIIVDERVVMKQLDRRRRILRVFRLSSDRQRRIKADERAYPLAAGTDGIAHRLTQHRRPRSGQHLGESLFDKI